MLIGSISVDFCQLIQGDALEKLKEISSATVQLCVTSPPYY